MIRPPNLLTLATALARAERAGYALGAFSARCTPMIAAVLAAGQAARSPLIVQISQRELAIYGMTPPLFAAEFYAQLAAQAITVPVVLHLDHTKDFPLIEEAIAAGFTSVMIDASEQPLAENIRRSRAVVEYAHAHGVAVEAELGRIGTTDFLETTQDEELYTDPGEAAAFAAQTGIDALAVSIGTAHGVYTVRQPRIDYDRLRAIRARTPVHLVLHGGSGVPAAMLAAAIRLPGGGVSKVNIATDLEIALLAALGRTDRLTDAECRALPPDQLAQGQAAVQALVVEKMHGFVFSAGQG